MLMTVSIVYHCIAYQGYWKWLAHRLQSHPHSFCILTFVLTSLRQNLLCLHWCQMGWCWSRLIFSKEKFKLNVNLWGTYLYHFTIWKVAPKIWYIQWKDTNDETLALLLVFLFYNITRRLLTYLPIPIKSSSRYILLPNILNLKMDFRL